MASQSEKVAVPGSAKAVPAGALSIGPAASNERFEVTVRVRRRNPLPSWQAMAAEPPVQRQHVTREEYEERYGAAPADLERVEQFASEHGLAVVESSSARRSVVLSGNVDAMSKAFGVTLERYEHAGGSFRGRTGEIFVPADLKDVVEGVFGFTDRPFAHPHVARAVSSNARAAGATFTPPQLAKLYNFPAGLDGRGQCIGILELGGGYRPADLKVYFQKLGLPVPKVKTVSVDHGRNQPTGSPDGPDGEVMMDIEIAAAVAPAAQIVVYVAPNTLQGFLDALTTAVHDRINAPSVISISWGGAEAAAEANFFQQFDQALQGAATLGVTVCCAAGDNGAADMGASEWDNRAHVDFPASSPFALACGGTRLERSISGAVRETVWNQKGVVGDSFGATGGGVSDFFPLPSWQEAAGVPQSANPGGRIGRGVPDVAGVADPATGYDIQVDGQLIQGFGGTSAVAPLWAGLVALLNQSLGKSVGYLNPFLYGLATTSGAFTDITIGDNRVGGSNIGYSARQGWDACTGLGSPNGAQLLKVLIAGK